MQTRCTKTRYNELIDNIYTLKQNFGISTLGYIFESIDIEFRNSDKRKLNYHIQAYNYRTILTPLGEIRFKRTVYKHKKTGE